MSFIKNKMLYVQSNNGISTPFCTVKKEIFLTSDLSITDTVNLYGNEYISAVLSPISIKVIRVYILNPDETIRSDISEFIRNDWSFEFNYNKGRTRYGNITLNDPDKKYLPSPVNGGIWKGTKFKVYIGLFYNNISYWRDCGIFVSGNPDVSFEDFTVSLSLYDKFALLDGTLGGKMANAYKIPVGTNVKESIQLCLQEKKSNGDIFDSKSIIFPIDLIKATTAYSIQKDPNLTLGEILLELSDIITCDIFYNNMGNLTIEHSVVTTDDFADNPIVWSYKDEQHTPLSFNIDFESLVNEITVAGCIENGKQYKATFKNISPQSQMNIYMTEPNPLYIEDTNIIGDAMCEARAKYEMIKQGRLSVQLNFKSIFIPHLNYNNLILFDNTILGFVGEKFIVNSVKYSADEGMDISISNINEVKF